MSATGGEHTHDTNLQWLWWASYHNAGLVSLQNSCSRTPPPPRRAHARACAPRGILLHPPVVHLMANLRLMRLVSSLSPWMRLASAETPSHRPRWLCSNTNSNSPVSLISTTKNGHPSTGGNDLSKDNSTPAYRPSWRSCNYSIFWGCKRPGLGWPFSPSPPPPLLCRHAENTLALLASSAPPQIPPPPWTTLTHPEEACPAGLIRCVQHCAISKHNTHVLQQHNTSTYRSRVSTMAKHI